jgi:hypothetical protein
MISFDDDTSIIASRSFLEWQNNPIILPPRAKDNFPSIIDQACSYLHRSPTMRSSFYYYDELLPEVIVSAAELKNSDAQCKALNILINKRLFNHFGDLLAAMTHEFTHVGHFIEELNHDHILNLDTARCLIEEADAVAHEITIMYELKEFNPEFWSRLKKDHRADYSLCCEAFEKAVNEDPEALWNGLASRTAFEKFLACFDMSHHVLKSGIFDFDTMAEDKLEEFVSSLANVLHHYYEAQRGMPFMHKDGEYIERDYYMNPRDQERIFQILQNRL